MKKFSFIIIFVLLVCCGCTAKYTLTYEDNKLDEKLEVTKVDKDNKDLMLRYTDGSKYLNFDNGSYKYSKDGEKLIYTYDMGDKIVETPLLKECYDKVYVNQTDDYIKIVTSGKYLCKGHELEVVFKTDKLVYDTNGKKVDKHTVKWDKDLDKGISLQVSRKEASRDLKKSAVSNHKVRLIIGVIILVIGAGAVFLIKKRMSEE